MVSGLETKLWTTGELWKEACLLGPSTVRERVPTLQWVQIPVLQLTRCVTSCNSEEMLMMELNKQVQGLKDPVQALSTSLGTQKKSYILSCQALF